MPERDEGGTLSAFDDRSLDSEFGEVVDSCAMALAGHTTEQLHRSADEAERRSPSGWLAPMIREYLDVWR